MTTTPTCHGPDWGVFYDGPCATCGEIPESKQAEICRDQAERIETLEAQLMFWRCMTFGLAMIGAVLFWMLVGAYK